MFELQPAGDSAPTDSTPDLGDLLEDVEEHFDGSDDDPAESA